MKTKYRYKGRSGDRMYWEARIPGDSRVDEVSCNWNWFWSNKEESL